MRMRSILLVTAAVIAASAVVLYTVLDRRSAGAAAANPGTAMSSSRTGSMATGIPGGPGSMPPGAAARTDGLVTIDVAAARLADRLGTKGGTGDEWALLARSYMELKQYPEAVAAYARARAALPGDATLVSEEAAARAAAAAK